MANPLTLTFNSENPNFVVQFWDYDNYGKPVAHRTEYPDILPNTTTTVTDVPMVKVNPAAYSVRLCIIPTNGDVVDDQTNDSEASMPWYTGLFDYPEKYLDSINFTMNQTNYNNLKSKTVVFDVVVIGGAAETNPPFNASYYLGKEELEQLSEVNFVEFNEGGSVSVNKSIFINDLIMIPFAIPDTYYPDKTNIKLGNSDTGILAPVLNTDLVEFDLGNITINDHQNSVLDFEGVNYELRLPFINEVQQIDASLIVNKTINVKMLLDIYTGECSINVYNGSEIPVLSYKAKIGRSIPIRIMDEAVNNLSSSSNIYNGITKAMLSRSKPELIDSRFSNLVTKKGLLTTVKGYVEVNNIMLNKNMSDLENELLIALLNRGVNIK